MAAQSNRLTAVSLLGAHLLVNCACFTTLSAFTAARQSWLLFPPAPVHPAAGIWITFAGADCRSTPIGRISNYFLRYVTSPDERRNPPPFPIAVPFLHVRTSPTHGRAPSPCKTRWVAKRLVAQLLPSAIATTPCRAVPHSHQNEHLMFERTFFHFPQAIGRPTSIPPEPATKGLLQWIFQETQPLNPWFSLVRRHPSSDTMTDTKRS